MLQHDAIELVEKMDPKKQFDAAGSAAATDPVCGMSVRPASAAGSFEHKGETYYFCSTHCLQKFRESPEQFLNKPTEPTVSQPVGISHTSSATLWTDRRPCFLRAHILDRRRGFLRPHVLQSPDFNIGQYAPLARSQHSIIN